MTEKLTLSELQLIIKDSLYIAFPDFFWVVAEISELKENYAGHCYMELIEKLPDQKDIKARIKAVIWSKRFSFLKPFFETSTGESLRAGMKILVKVKVEYHELYGLSLVISDIDPAFTLGDMAVKRQAIIKRLEDEGVFTMNRELEFPPVPQKIAIISSRNAAGFVDFTKHLNENSYGYVFYTALFDSVMQGTETEESIINSLNRIAEHAHLFDAAVIIRGGGSTSDLSWFDSYNIAYHITQFPLPVLTGIGHEKDFSVSDMVAFQALKTPTAVADYLIGCMAEAEAHLDDLASGVTDNSMQIILDSRARINSFSTGLTMAARLSSESGKKSVERLRSDLTTFTLHLLNDASDMLEVHESTLNILNPVNVLKRGYTITRNMGRIIKSISQVEAEDEIETCFSDGIARSKVFIKSKDIAMSQGRNSQ